LSPNNFLLFQLEVAFVKNTALQFGQVAAAKDQHKVQRLRNERNTLKPSGKATSIQLQKNDEKGDDFHRINSKYNS
jgi:hypothetical protein